MKENGTFQKGVVAMRKSLALMVFLVLSVTALFAGTTGKIRGTVVNESGELLPGATIMLVDTQLGAAADGSGSFFILQVPPGIYTVKALMVGYTTETIQGVIVSVDSTTTLTIKLKQRLAGSEEVMVNAKKEIVRKDNTSTVEKLDSSKIKNMVVSTVGDVLNIQKGASQISAAGNTIDGSVNEERGDVGGLHIRGGRGNEVTYMVNGVSTQNWMNGTTPLDVSTDAIQEMSVMTGGFNAEYGNAMSAVINIVTKEGDRKKYHGGLTFTTDALLKKADKVSPGFFEAGYGYNNLGVFASGPIYGTKFSFMTTFDFTQRDAVGHRIPDIEDLPSDLAFYEDGVLNTDLVPEYYTPHTGYIGQNYQVKISGNIIPAVKLETDILGSFSETEFYQHAYRYNLKNYAENETKSLLVTERITHTLSSKTYYALTVGYFEFESRTIPARGSDGEIGDFIRPYEETVERVYDPYNLFYVDGHYIAFTEQSAKYYTFKGEVTSQLNNYNQVKAGFELQIHNLKYFNVSYPTGANYQTIFDVKPVLGYAFIQDKLEYDTMIINAGIRLDAFDPSTKYFEDPTAFISGGTSPLVEADKKFVVSPRFGLALPISDNTVLRFHYGHFYQMPEFSYLYDNILNPDWYKPGFPLLGNPNLEMQKTIAYELGVDQRLSEDWKVTVVTYYKDVSNLLYTEQIIDPIKSYTLYTNGGYSQIRGFEIGLSKLYSNNISGDINYSLSWADGNASSERDGYYGVVTVSGGERTPPARKYALAFDRRHAVKVNFDLRARDNEGPEMFGVKPLENAGVNFLFSYESGAPYTPRDVTNRNIGPMNSKRMPSTKSLDMKINKDFMFKFMGENLSVGVFCTISNVFDWVNYNSVYATTGQPTDNGRYGEAEGRPDPYTGDAYSFSQKYKEYWGANPEFFGAPRYVRFGVGISF